MIAALRAFFQSILSWFRTPVEKPLTAEDRFRANLRTVDQHGNLLEDSRRIDKGNEA